MKDAIGFMVIGFMIGTIFGGYVGELLVKKKAKASGAGEYYLDENDNKKWRWK